jgi:hypothetical protein
MQHYIHVFMYYYKYIFNKMSFLVQIKFITEDSK